MRRKRRLHQFLSSFPVWENRVHNLATKMAGCSLMVLQALGKGAQVKRKNYLCNIKQQKDLIQKQISVICWSGLCEPNSMKNEFARRWPIQFNLFCHCPSPKLAALFREGIRGTDYGILLRVKRRWAHGHMLFWWPVRRERRNSSYAFLFGL